MHTVQDLLTYINPYKRTFLNYAKVFGIKLPDYFIGGHRVFAEHQSIDEELYNYFRRNKAFVDKFYNDWHHKKTMKQLAEQTNQDISQVLDLFNSGKIFTNRGTSGRDFKETSEFRYFSSYQVIELLTGKEVIVRPKSLKPIVQTTDNSVTNPMDLGLNLRKDILARALMVESLTTNFLGALLGVKDVKNSRALGKKSSPLSFNQKIDLLMELDTLSAYEKKKFQAFMEIRNQFIHNLNAATYTDCYSYLSGTDKLVFKLYPQPGNLTREEKLKNASISLAEEVLTLTVTIIENVKQKIAIDVKTDIGKKSNEAFFDSIKQTKVMLDQFIDQLISSNKPISRKKLKGLGNFVSKLIYSNWQKNLKNY